jgi:cytochrome P450
VPAHQPEVDFDHMSPAFGQDPAAAFRGLRESCPVAWTPHHGGFWVLTRYEDIAAAARDDATFSSARPSGGKYNVIAIPYTESGRNVPIEMDPPEFFAFRRLLNPILSPATVNSVVVPMLEATTQWCIDRFIERGTADLVDDLTAPVPAIFTMGWLGLPVEEWQAFVVAKRLFVLPVDQRAEALSDLHAVERRWREVVQSRRAEPRDDIISYLAAQEVEGRPITDEEVVDMVTLLIHGGFGTSNHLMGQTFMHLSRDRNLRERLRNEPDLVGPATEEFLRYFPPNTHLARIVTHDTEVSGCPMSAGDRVMLPWYSANRDPDAFPDPDEFVADRFPNRHTAFGLGIHRCVGSNVARQLFRVVLSAVLERLPDYTVDEARAIEMPTQGVSTGWAKLPVTFTPGPRLGVPPPFPGLA